MNAFDNMGLSQLAAHGNWFAFQGLLLKGGRNTYNLSVVLSNAQKFKLWLVTYFATVRGVALTLGWIPMFPIE